MPKQGRIKNKVKRQEVYYKEKQEKKVIRHEKKIEKLEQKQRQVQELVDIDGLDEEAAYELVNEKIQEQQHTLDRKRLPDETFVDLDDKEIINDDNDDEFNEYFKNTKQAKVMITTRPRPSKQLYEFIRELMQLVPNSFLFKRGKTEIKNIVKYAYKRNYTHLIVLGEKNKICNQLLVTHLPNGPSALFKITNYKPSQKIRNHGRVTDHMPELILQNFKTRLGHRVGRLIGSMFPHNPEFNGRQVVTIHNQRDFLFVRHHRYIFKNNFENTNLQELGPRFTMRLKYLLADSFDTKHGEYEWIRNRKKQENSRTQFSL